MKRSARILFGACCWLLAVLALGRWQHALTSGERRAQQRWLADTREFLTGQRSLLVVRLPRPTYLVVGDPVFHRDAQGELHQVREVHTLADGNDVLPRREGTVLHARLLLYPTAPDLGRAGRVRFQTRDASLAWVVETLLTSERKAKMMAALRRVLAEHQAEIVAAFRPVVEDSLRDALAVVEQDLPTALTRQKKRLAALGAKYQRDVVRQDLLPLVQAEIWPLVRKRAEKPVRKLGRELWDRVSLWSFGWRWLYDVSPLPERNLAEREWTRFMKEDALPVFKEHADEFVGVVKHVLRDVSANKKVRAVAKSSLIKIVDDPELHAIVQDVFREVVLENPRLHAALEEHWKSQQAKSAMALASARLEPTLREFGDLVFGTPSQGITPEFARVLRSQILAKDARWFLLETSDEVRRARRRLNLSPRTPGDGASRQAGPMP